MLLFLKTNPTGNYSCLQVDLLFTRDDAFYFSTLFIPGIILVTSSFIGFWLQWNAVPARVMIGVTTMLSFFTTSNSFRSTLPVVSNLAAMNMWDSVCMFFIYVSFLEFVVVNYIGRKRPKHNMVYMPGENAVIQVRLLWYNLSVIMHLLIGSNMSTDPVISSVLLLTHVY